MSFPTIATSSSSVLARWEPVPLTMVTLSGGTWESSSKSQGRRRSRGRARVMSGITTASVSPAPISSFSGAEPVGCRTASMKAAASSGSPSSGLGASTVTLEDGTSMLRLPVPYCSCASTVEDLPVPRLRPIRPLPLGQFYTRGRSRALAGGAGGPLVDPYLSVSLDLDPLARIPSRAGRRVGVERVRGGRRGLLARRPGLRAPVAEGDVDVVAGARGGAPGRGR